MAVAEGIEPIFFDSEAVSNMFGMRLSGMNFAPFTTNNNRLYSVSLVGLLWEFATTFGAARLQIGDTGDLFEVQSLGEGVSWQPYYSYEDLLWTRTYEGEGAESREGTVRKGANGLRSVSESRIRGDRPVRARSLKGAYSFSLDSMINLMVELDERSSITDEEARTVAGVRSDSGYGEYYNFLIAGTFASRGNGFVGKREKLGNLLTALRGSEFDVIAELLCGVPSFSRFVEMLRVGEPTSQEAAGLRQDAFRTYCRLAEMSCKGVRILEHGVYGTPYNPTPSQFVDTALDAYDAVRGGEGFALTGMWLEELATRFGIHPVRARQRLAEANQSGYLRRFFEGSTPETRFENRTINVVATEQGRPVLRTINLYHGDFLMAGRASVGIKLVKGGAE